MEFVARLLSWVFLPLFIPIYALGVALYIEAYQFSIVQLDSLYVLPDKHKSLLIYLFAAMSAVFPILAILFLRINGRITNILMDKRSERLVPGVFVNGSAIVLYLLLRKLDPHSYLPYSVYALVSGCFVTVLIATFITWWWKISLHSAGMGIFTAFIFCYFGTMDVFPFWILPATLILSGMVLSVRMYLKCHSILEITAGYFLGIVATTVCMLVARA